MIKNERQYRITRAQAERFERTIAAAGARPSPAIHPKLQKAQLDGLRSQLGDLQRELREYEALRSGRRRVIPLDSIEELPKTLIQARIASGVVMGAYIHVQIAGSRPTSTSPARWSSESGSRRATSPSSVVGSMRRS